MTATTNPTLSIRKPRPRRRALIAAALASVLALPTAAAVAEEPPPLYEQSTNAASITAFGGINGVADDFTVPVGERWSITAIGLDVRAAFADLDPWPVRLWDSHPDTGLPDAVLAETSLAELTSGFTRFEFPEPVVLEPGRYWAGASGLFLRVTDQEAGLAAVRDHPPLTVGWEPLAGSFDPDRRWDLVFAVYGTVTVVDDTPPELTLPGNLTVDATGPAGADVTYAATAEDDVDGPLTPDCQPASGSLFPIGTTTVTCTATDVAGNEESGSFTVTVRGAAAQLANLRTYVSGLPVDRNTKKQLRKKIDGVVERLSPDDKGPACSKLGALANKVEDLHADGRLTTAQADRLRSDVARIGAVLDC